MKTEKSINPCKFLPVRQAGVIPTSYDIVKTLGGEIKVNTAENEGTEFIISIPVNQ
jgi:hypothetical protein